MSTIRQLMKKTEERLENEEKDVNVAKVLFFHLSKLQPHELYLDYDKEVDNELENTFNSLMELYFNGQPIQYIIGEEVFFSREFIVNEKVLIPRFETEELVEQILYIIDDYFDDYKSITTVDVGTGSGAIAISLDLEEPRTKVYASDISSEAIEIATKNNEKLGGNVTFYEGDMLEPFIQNNIKVDLFVSNPPYIPSNQQIESLVKDNEPHVALFGGEDGLYFYRKIFENVKIILNEKAVLCFEMGYDQRSGMERLIKEVLGDVDFEIKKDMAGKDRMLFIYYGISR